MKRIIISMTAFVALTLLISANGCGASFVNIDGTYEGSNAQGTIQLKLKRNSNNRVSGTFLKKMGDKFTKTANITGTLKDQGGLVILTVTIKLTTEGLSDAEKQLILTATTAKLNTELANAQAELVTAKASGDTTQSTSLEEKIKSLEDAINDPEKAYNSIQLPMELKVLSNGATLEDTAGNQYKKK